MDQTAQSIGIGPLLVDSSRKIPAGPANKVVCDMYMEGRGLDSWWSEKQVGTYICGGKRPHIYHVSGWVGISLAILLSCYLVYSMYGNSVSWNGWVWWCPARLLFPSNDLDGAIIYIPKYLVISLITASKLMHHLLYKCWLLWITVRTSKS